MKIIALASVTTVAKRFAIKVRLQGVSGILKFTKDYEEKAYITCAGVDDAGDRIGLTFFGQACEQQRALLNTGRTVILTGAQVRIKDSKYSVSSGKFDLIYDRYCGVEVVEAGPREVKAAAATMPVRDLLMSKGLVRDAAVIYLNHNELQSLKNKAGGTFAKLVILCCDSSTEKRFEIHATGPVASRLSTALDDVEGGQSLLLHAAVFGGLEGKWRGCLRGSIGLTIGGQSREESQFLMCLLKYCHMNRSSFRECFTRTGACRVGVVENDWER